MARARRFDEARGHLAEAEKGYGELEERYLLANHCLRVRGRIEMLAGEPTSAEAALSEACAVLERVHDEAGLSTIGSELADALYAEGRYDEAADWLDLAETRSSAADVSAQYTWRRVRAKVLARCGDHGSAETLAREAAEHVSPVPAADPETFLLGVVAVRRDRELRALQLETARAGALSSALPSAPRGFPER